MKSGLYMYNAPSSSEALESLGKYIKIIMNLIYYNRWVCQAVSELKEMEIVTPGQKA